VVRRSLQDELLRLQGDLHKTIVFVTHDIDEAVRIGDMVCVLRQGGRIGQYATPERLLAAPADDFVAEFLGEDRGVRRLAFVNSGVLRLRDEPPAGPVVRTFRHGTDSLRAALDSAVLNPSGQAVGVDGTGRVLGTATQEDVIDAISHLDDAVPEAVPVDGGEPR
jgi:osmoprotectant transport system ATP-binding protein